jgi:glyoxalase family protein
MTPTLNGIHHVTAIASDPQRNLDFYTQVLGLRLVKLTVNFDDPGTYHFYFGNATGAPGSILTFFPWVGMRRGTVGNGQVSATAFAVRPGSLEYWLTRLKGRGVAVREAGERFGEPVLTFSDPDGMPLELVGSASASAAGAWLGEDVPAEHAIAGFHGATLLVGEATPTLTLLAEMGLQLLGTEGARTRYAFADAAVGRVVDVVAVRDGLEGRMGAGTVHHIAWRTPDDPQQGAWRQRLAAGGANVSPIMDRSYFHSIYFREPGGILFEIATDPPGFATDETPDHLGEALRLPPWMEGQRPEAEQRLPALTLPHMRAVRS